VQKYSLPFPVSLYSIPVVGSIAVWLSTNPTFAPLTWLLYRTFASNVVTLNDVQAYSFLLGKIDGGEGLLNVVNGADTSSKYSESLLKDLADAKFPTQAIWSKDHVIPESQHQLDTIKKLTKPTHVTEVPAKHYIQEDRPKEFAKLVGTFVRSVSKAFPEDEGHEHAGHSHSHAGHSHEHAGHSHEHAGDSHGHAEHAEHAGHSHEHAGHSHGHSHEHAGHSHGHSHGHDDTYGAGHNYGL